MKTIIRLLSLIFALVGISGSSHAQIPVYVFTRGATEQPVIDALKAKIGSTTRYTLADEANSKAIWVLVDCLAIQGGYACSYTTAMLPDSLTPFEISGPHTLCAGPDRLSVAEIIFEDFVKGTTDKNLELWQKARLIEVTLFCRSAEHKKYCQPEPIK